MADLTIDIPTDGTLLHAHVDAGKLVWLENDQGTLLDDLTASTWAKVTSQVTQLIQGLRGRELAKGISLYDIDVRIAQDWTRTVQRRGAGSLALTIVSGRCTIIATSTTPTVLGKYADPRFSVDFGVMVTVVLAVPPALAPLRVTAVEDLRILLQRIDSQNLPGDIVMAVTRTAAAMANLSIEGTAQRMLDGLDLPGQATAQLGPINAQLASLAADGYAYQELLAGDPASLARQLGAAYGIPDAAAQLRSAGAPTDTQALMLVSRRPDLSGVIEGEIAWRADSGAPVDRTTAAMLDRILSSSLAGDTLRTLRTSLTGSAASSLSTWASVSRPPLEQLTAAAASASSPDAVAQAVVADTAVRAPLATAATLQAQRPFSEASVWGSDGPAPAPPPEVAPLRLGAAQLAETLGSRVAYEDLMDLFRLGPVQFEVGCTNASGMPSGRTTMMWWDDDAGGWSRRRYRVEDVETDTPLSVSCQLAQDWVWRGGTVRAVEPVNWSGRVTVKPARDLVGPLTSESVHATVVQADGSRRTVSLRALEEAGVVSGVRAGEDRSIIVVGGRVGDRVSLNPQPLPPKEQTLGKRLVGRVGGLAGKVALNPQPLPPKGRSMGKGLRGRLSGVMDKVVHRSDSVTEALREAPTTQQSPDLVTTVDDFGTLGLSHLDLGDITVPDVADPTGHGTVRGIDFRVRADGTG